VLAVLFAALAGLLFGAMAAAVQVGLRRGGEPIVGGLVIALLGLGVSALAAGADQAWTEVSDLWPFFVTGLLVPGVSQVVFILAIRDAGASRTGILIGTAPLMSVLIALALLGEPARPELLAGTLLVVAGGVSLSRERARPEHFRAIGALLALTCATLFAIRDNLTRWAARDVHPPALIAATTALLAASVFLLAYTLAIRRRGLVAGLRPALVAFWPAGLALGLGYDALLEAFDRGRVGVVAPLNATQSLWAVVFAALLVGRSEMIGRRTVLAGSLVVAGSALIGVFR
jgi:drug/metabolite transporter (DMT)-like permease